VGKEPPRALERAAEQGGVDLVGYVPSIEDELARATVAVVPLWAGAGVRVKIVEALAARLPVAATRLAAEGLGLTPGEHYAAGGTPGELGGQVATLLLSANIREALARKGREVAEERWEEGKILDLQNALCAEITPRGEGRS
jgi:glycosyltransferase involved in cell wall biosynthesis